MEDTVKLARQEQKRQGPWEAEVSFGGEADFHKHLIACDKNHGHPKFVPVEQFSVDHIYPGCRDVDLVNFIRAVADLTVRVVVNYVSEKRPETVLGGKLAYPCYRNRGSHMTRTGTGWMKMLQIHTDKDIGSETCQCPECVNSPTPRTRFAYVYINTAAHVVYDHLEAARSDCNFFFDDRGTPDECEGVVTLHGMSVVYSDVNRDVCTIQYVTHDVNVMDRIQEKIIHLCGLWKRSLETCRYQERTDTQMSTDELNDSLSIIVSHPHGCSKQVSVGQYTGTGLGSCLPNTYNTATCPGSSGALVFVVREGQFISLGRFIYHSGCDKNINFSSMTDLLEGDFSP